MGVIPFTPADWADIGVGVGALLTMVYIVRTMRSVLRDNQEFMAQHLVLMSQAMKESAQAIEKLESTIDMNREKTLRSHAVLASKLGGKVGAALSDALEAENGLMP